MKPSMDPYFAGIGLGLVLLACYVLEGRGLGASGAFFSIVAGGNPWHDWVTQELAGATLGGFVSAWLAGRVRWGVRKGAGITSRQRMWAAVAGGVLMGVGAKFARGCTSGQALSGGALLSVGSWIFIATCFAAAYAAAPLMRRLWL